MDEHPMFTIKLKEHGFSYEERKSIIDCLTTTCQECWETDLNERDCHCWKDE